eukprot:scaffold363_cov209-Alexandrium_tamarense.AAC.30
MNLVHVCLCIFVHCQLVVSSSIDYSLFLALPPLQRHNDPPSTKSPSQTTIQKMIRGCDGAADDEFGWDLAVKGDWAAIGARGVSSKSGAVYLYKHNGNHWVFMQSLTASDGAALDWFGRAVAMSGTGHLVVGAPYDDDKGSSSGSVYLYTLNSSSNTWGDEQKIVSSDGATDDWFGWSVAMSGTGHLVVGALRDDDKGDASGSAYLYTLNSTSNTWGDEQKIVSSDGAADDRIGLSVAMSGTGHLVVGAPNDDDKGSAYLYTLNSTSNTWGDEQKIVSSDGAADDLFGRAVAMSGTGHLVVGAYADDDKGSSSGSVYLYTLNSTSNTWGDEQKIVSSDGATNDWFGWSVAMSGTGHLVVGARGDDDNGSSSGSVYLYTLNSTSNTWGDEQKIVASDGAAYKNFGNAVAMSGTGHLVVGAFGDDDMGSNSGSVYTIGEGGIHYLCDYIKIYHENVTWAGHNLYQSLIPFCSVSKRPNSSNNATAATTQQQQQHCVFWLEDCVRGGCKL